MLSYASLAFVFSLLIFFVPYFRKNKRYFKRIWRSLYSIPAERRSAGTIVLLIIINCNALAIATGHLDSSLFTLRSSLRKCFFNSQLQYHYCLWLSAPLFSHDANEPLCTKAVCCWMLVPVNSFMSDAYVHALLSVFSFCLFRLQYGFKKNAAFVYLFI